MKSAKTVRLRVSFEYEVHHWNNHWDSVAGEERHLGRALPRIVVGKVERLRVERVEKGKRGKR